MSATLEQIEAQVRAYNPDADLTGLDEAYEFAHSAHKGQVRKSGEAFVNHPIEVALILAELHMDTATLKAALLHDTVEDSEASIEEVRELFGDEVAELVDGVTKLGKIEFESMSEAQSNNLRKMLHQLRHALPDGAEFLLADANTVQWAAGAPFRLAHYGVHPPSPRSPARPSPPR